MKFSRFITALAVVGLMGCLSSAFADDPSPTELANVDFESYTVGAVSNVLVSVEEWTVQEDDESAIASEIVTAFGVVDNPDDPEDEWTWSVPQFIIDTYGSVEATTKLLNLKTAGKELSYGVESAVGDTVIVDMIVKLVGSDSAPKVEDTDVQTAVYLNTDDGYIYGLGSVIDGQGTVNEWIKLDTGDQTFVDGQSVLLQISVDYTNVLDSNGSVTVKVNGSEIGGYPAANKSNTWAKKKINSVSFQGTGLVDNFVVNSVESQLESVTMITKFVDLDGEPLVTPEAGVQYWFGSSFTYEFSEEEEFDDVIYTLVGATLEPQGESFDSSVLINTDNGFEDGGTYTVVAVYDVKKYQVDVVYVSLDEGFEPVSYYENVKHGESFSTVDVTALFADGFDTGDFGVAIALPSDPENFVDEGDIDSLASGKFTIGSVTEDLIVYIYGLWADPGGGGDPEPEIVVEEDTLVFTSIELANGKLTVTFAGEGTVEGNEAEGVTMALLVTEDLEGTPFLLEVRVDAEADEGEVTGTAVVDLAELEEEYDTLFILGLSVVEPQDD